MTNNQTMTRSVEDWQPVDSRGNVRLPDGRRIGEIKDRTLYKRIRRQHIVKVPEDGIAMERYVWAAIEPFVDKLVVEDLDSGRKFTASAELFGREHYVFDRGYGVQRMLPLRLWSVT